MRNIFFKDHAEIEAGRLVSDLFLYEVKASGDHLSFNIFW